MRMITLIKQGDIGKLQETLTSLTVQMEQVKEEREYDRRRVEDLTNDVAMSQTKNHELTRDLHKALDEVIRSYDAIS